MGSKHADLSMTGMLPILQLYVNPVERYLHPDEQLTFYDAILRGRQKGHIVLVRRRPMLPMRQCIVQPPPQPLQGHLGPPAGTRHHQHDFAAVQRALSEDSPTASAMMFWLQGYCERDSGKIVLNPKNKGARFLSRDSTEAFVVLAESP
jgi:hypothetical protein